MNTELRDGFIQMMARSGSTPGRLPDPGDLVARRQQVATFAATERRYLPQMIA